MGRSAAELVGEDEPTVAEELSAKVAALEAENAALKTMPEKKKSPARSER